MSEAGQEPRGALASLISATVKAGELYAPAINDAFAEAFQATVARFNLDDVDAKELFRSFVAYEIGRMKLETDSIQRRLAQLSAARKAQEH